MQSYSLEVSGSAVEFKLNIELRKGITVAISRDDKVLRTSVKPTGNGIFIYDEDLITLFKVVNHSLQILGAHKDIMEEVRLHLFKSANCFLFIL